MREIKYRAWDEKRKRMVYLGWNWTNDADCIPVDGNWDDIVHSEWLIWMQFTGLRDANGKDIYEGDIIKIPRWRDSEICEKCGCHKRKDGYAEISFSNELVSEYGVRSRATFVFKIDFEEYELDDVEKYEVIGNIYANPELLKEER